MANRQHYPLRGRASEIVYLSGTFETNSTSDPDGITGDISTVVRDDVGDFTVTFKGGGYKQLDFAHAVIAEDNAVLTAKVHGGTIGSGTVTMTVYEEDGTSGISAAADTDDQTIRVIAYVRNTVLTAR